MYGKLDDVFKSLEEMVEDTKDVGEVDKIAKDLDKEAEEIKEDIIEVIEDDKLDAEEKVEEIEEIIEDIKDDIDEKKDEEVEAKVAAVEAYAIVKGFELKAAFTKEDLSTNEDYKKACEDLFACEGITDTTYALNAFGELFRVGRAAHNREVMHTALSKLTDPERRKELKDKVEGAPGIKVGFKCKRKVTAETIVSISEALSSHAASSNNKDLFNSTFEKDNTKPSSLYESMVQISGITDPFEFLKNMENFTVKIQAVKHALQLAGKNQAKILKKTGAHKDAQARAMGNIGGAAAWVSTNLDIWNKIFGKYRKIGIISNKMIAIANRIAKMA